MGKIVITGASGRYGRMATDGLIARGRAADLILMTRDPAKLADRIAAGCMVRYGDFDRPETLGPVMAGAERLLLISGTRVGARVVQHRAVVDAAAGRHRHDLPRDAAATGTRLISARRRGVPDRPCP